MVNCPDPASPVIPVPRRGTRNGIGDGEAFSELGRLTRSEDFSRVRRDGARWRGKYCVLNAVPTQPRDELCATSGDSNEAKTRVGYIASKSLGNAAQRNRARRLLREAMRHSSDSIAFGWDIVLVAQPAIITERARMQRVQEDLLWLLNKAHLIRETNIEK